MNETPSCLILLDHCLCLGCIQMKVFFCSLWYGVTVNPFSLGGSPASSQCFHLLGLTSFFSHIGKFLISPKQSVNPSHNSPLASSIKISAHSSHGDTAWYTSSLWNSEGSLYTPCPYVKNALFRLYVETWPEVQWWHPVAWPWPLSQVEVEHGLNSGL